MPTAFDTAMRSLNGNLVYKFGSGGLYIADYETPCPQSVLSADNTDFLPPTGFVFAGLMTVDGVTTHRAMSTADVPAWQTTQVIRSDVDSDFRSFSVKLLENNVASIAVKLKQPIATLAMKPGAAGHVDSPVDGAEPLRRGFWIAYDRKRDVFRGQIFPQISLSAPGDEIFKRADANMADVTFTAYYDAGYGTDCRDFIGGAGWTASGPVAPPV